MGEESIQQFIVIVRNNRYHGYDARNNTKIIPSTTMDGFQ